MADCSTCGGAGCMDDSGAKCPVCGGTGEEPKCPYGMSGDTCVPIMEDYPCICALQALNAELVAALEGALEVMQFAYMNAPKQPKEIAQARATLKKAEPQ